jgi:L-aminopeptidase/D-esterase-like protein
MAQQAIEEEKSTPDEEEELEPESRDEAADESDNDDGNASTEPSTTTWAIRGAVLGAIAGGAAGAGLGALVARRPGALKDAKDVIRANSRQVAQAAAIAAAAALNPRRLNQLVTGNGDGDRSDAIKESAREAGAAAAKAARDEIISLRKKAA